MSGGISYFLHPKWNSNKEYFGNGEILQYDLFLRGAAGG
jgi:hypothetical protein